MYLTGLTATKKILFIQNSQKTCGAVLFYDVLFCIVCECVDIYVYVYVHIFMYAQVCVFVYAVGTIVHPLCFYTYKDIMSVHERKRFSSPK